MKSRAHSREMYMALRESRVEKSVGHGHKYEKQHIYTEIETESVSNSGIQ